MSPGSAARGATIDDVLHASPLGPILDLKVDDVLKSLGIGGLPSIPPLPPLPGFPALPPLDLSVLIRPVLDLLGSFGSGDLGASSGANPLGALSGIGEVLRTTMSMGTQALSVADKLWSGTSATATAAKSAAAHADSASLAAQGAAMRVQTGEAAAIVAEGLALLQGVVAKFVAIAAAAAPTLMTPPGQAVVLAAAADGLAEASAVVAATRAQLLAPLAQIAATGAPVPVTDAPVAGPSPFQVAGELLQTLGPPVVSGIGKALSSVGEVGGSLLAPQHASATVPAAATDSAAGPIGVPSALAPGGSGGTTSAGALGGLGGLAAAGSRGGGVSSGGGSSSAVGVPPTPLAPFAPTAGARGEPGLTQASAEGSAKPSVAGSRATVTTGGSAMAPVGAMGAMGAANAARSGSDYTPAEYLVSESATADLIGELPAVVPAVLGQAEPPPQPDVVLRLGTST